MRRALIAAVLFAACASPLPSEPRDQEGEEVYLSIGTDAVPTAHAVAAAQGARLAHVETAGEVAVLAFPAEDLDELSHAMHEQHGRCGGFMVHDSLEEARAARLGARARPRSTTRSIVRAAVRAVLPAIDAARDPAARSASCSAMQNRYYQSATGAAASTWLRDRWQSFTTRPDVTIELFDHGYAQKSVILTIPGSTRPERGGRDRRPPRLDRARRQGQRRRPAPTTMRRASRR